jgi:hypothetical protein
MNGHHDFRKRGSPQCFRSPDLSAYERQKDLITVSNWGADVQTPRTPAKAVFLRRIDCALRRRPDQAPNIFPGNLVPQPGTASTFVDRGILFYEQYRFYKQWGLYASPPPILSVTPIDPRTPWPWRWERPNLFLLKESSGAHQEAATTEHAFAFDRVRLLRDCLTYQYSAQSLEFLRRLTMQALSIKDRDPALLVLFEIEAAASFLTFTERMPVLLEAESGRNWTAVYCMPLLQIRQTELCETERIFDELFNLGRVRFAPIVVNEYSTIADGNHRFTSAWIWNVLRQCLSQSWNLDCKEFQDAIWAAMNRLDLFSVPTTAHEVLFHLGVLLSRYDIAATLEARLKPVLRHGSDIAQVPVVLLPEYLSGAADKGLYDAGTAVKRAHPAIYRTIAEAPNTVLPARASYHYTDCVPLPWFDVIH